MQQKPRTSSDSQAMRDKAKAIVDRGAILTIKHISGRDFTYGTVGAGVWINEPDRIKFAPPFPVDQHDAHEIRPVSWKEFLCKDGTPQPNGIEITSEDVMFFSLWEIEDELGAREGLEHWRKHLENPANAEFLDRFMKEAI